MLDILFLVLIIGGVLLLLIALFMMLYWKVFGLIDEISGRRAKRQIEKMRQYNATNDTVVTSVSTGELELMMSSGGSLLNEPVTKTSEPSKGRSLREMIDDPYGSVGRYTSRRPTIRPVVEPPQEVYSVDEEVTGLLEDVAAGEAAKKSIIILDEQSSI